MRSFFPISAKATSGMALVISVVIYLALSFVTGFALGLFTGIPVVGAAIGFVSQLIDLYCWGGIVVAIMIFFKVV